MLQIVITILGIIFLHIFPIDDMAQKVLASDDTSLVKLMNKLNLGFMMVLRLNLSFFCPIFETFRKENGLVGSISD